MWVTLRQASSLSPQTYLNFKKSGKKKERKKEKNLYYMEKITCVPVALGLLIVLIYIS